MKRMFEEIILVVLKWFLILIIAGCVFYVVCPKYQLVQSVACKFNTITGSISMLTVDDVKKGDKK